MRRAAPRAGRAAALGLAVVVAVLVVAGPAVAHEPPIGAPRGVFAADDELAEIAILPTLGAGQNLTILLPEAGTVDPLAGYPATDPIGATSELVFAGIILAERRPVVAGSEPLQLYCVQVLVETSTGVGYVNRPWADVENLGLVAQVLANYFPATGEPASLANDNQRAAAVQAAIWFLTDGVVVPTTNPTIRAAAAAIVADVLALGPLDEPSRPTISITPASASAPIGSVAGPFTVEANGPVTLTVDGGQLFEDAAGTVPLPTPATLPSGSQFFVRSDDPGGASLSIRGAATVFRGTQYFFDGGDPDLDDAQRLILAQTAVADAVATAEVTFFDTGALSVTKSLVGPAAGSQGEVRIEVACDTIAFDPLVIPAGTPGPVTQVFTGIPTPATCTITETADGSNASTQVDVTGGSQTIELAANTTPDDEVTADIIVNTYTTTTTTSSGTGTGAGGGPDATIPATGARGPGSGTPTLTATGSALVGSGTVLVGLARRHRRRFSSQ